MVLGHVSSPFLDGKLIQQPHHTLDITVFPRKASTLTLTVLKTTGRISLCMGHTTRFHKPVQVRTWGPLFKSIKNLKVVTVSVHQTGEPSWHGAPMQLQVAHSWGPASQVS